MARTCFKGKARVQKQYGSAPPTRLRVLSRRVVVSERGRGRRRYRVDTGWLVGPHQQHRTRSVVDNEPGGRAQAVRTQAGVIAVAGHDQQVDILGDGPDDFTLDPSPTLEKLRILTAQSRRGGSEQRRGGVVGNFLEGASGSASREPPEQPGRGRLGNSGDVGGGDVEESDLGS